MNFTSYQKRKIVELFKSHYTAKEVSEIMQCNYNTIATYFSAFRKLDIKKYDRSCMIPEEIRNDVQNNI